ncbi:MAG: hypothetical protein AAF826_09330 [Pseudomonadota bacterium]
MERRDLLIHLGPHKTGSTYIQKMIVMNQDNAPANIQLIPKRGQWSTPLHKVLVEHQTPEDIGKYKDDIVESADIFGSSITSEAALFSDEDLLGALPTRRKRKGLYPTAGLILPLIAEGLQHSGVAVRFAFFVRDYRDWLQSLHAQTYGDKDRSYAPKTFRTRFDLPRDWTDLQNRMDASLPKGSILYFDYHAEAASHYFGQSLFKAAGLTQTHLDQFTWIKPVNTRADVLKLD